MNVEDDPPPLQQANQAPTSNGTDLPANYPFHDPLASFGSIKTVYVHGTPVRCKYCNSCRIWRPPRTSHCSQCGRCVESIDHHCPWVGTCVAKRNYRYFFFFILSISFLSLYVMILSIIHMHLDRFESEELGQVISRHPVNMVLIVFSFIMCWSLFSLLVFHSWLSCKNLTTNEHVRFLVVFLS